MIDITDKKTLENIFAQDFGSPYFPILADLYLKEGDLRRARLVCDVGLQHSFDNDRGKYILAKIALSEEKLTVAEKWLKQAVHDNMSNFNALRSLIKLEITLNRSPNTIRKYIQHILRFIPNDVECQNWTAAISDNLEELQLEKDVTSKVKDKLSSSKSNYKTKIINAMDYRLEDSMATFTMLRVLKTQKHYNIALDLLKLLESKNLDKERIHKERGDIQSLLSQDSQK